MKGYNMTSELTTIIKKLDEVDGQFKNILNLANQMQNTSKDILGNKNKLTQQFENINKNLSLISKTFELSNNIVSSTNDGFIGFQAKLAQLEKTYQKNQDDYKKNGEKYAGLEGLWQYAAKLENKQYERDVRDINSEKETYLYEQISALFSGYAGISTEAFGENNLASTILSNISTGFSIAGKLTSSSNRLDQINDQKSDLKAKYAEDLLYQQAALEQQQISYQEYADNIVTIEQDMNDKLSELSLEHTMLSIDMFSTMAGGVADLLKQMGAEGSAAYKVMFLASKASGIAQAIISTEVAANKALELGGTFGTVMSAVVRGMGYASVGIIASQTLSGMAHSGIDSIPREGTWLLDKGERVVDARTNADLKNFLQSSGQSSSGLNVNVPVTIGSSDISEEDGKQLGMMIKLSVMNIIQEQQRPGGVLNRY